MSNIAKKSDVCGKIPGKTPVNHVTYSFRSSHKNSSYQGSAMIPLRSCLLRNNSSQPVSNLVTGNPVYDQVYGFVQSQPKRYSVLTKCETNPLPGMPALTTIETTDLKASKNRMLQKVNSFCDFYEPLYQAHKVSVLFFTFTRANYSSKTIATMLECVRKRLKVLKWPLRGYIWVLESKKNQNMEGGYHVHYHLVIAVDRVNIVKIPNELKVENLWGQRTGVEFIRKTIRGYLSKELSKANAKVCYRRRYGISKKFI